MSIIYLKVFKDSCRRRRLLIIIAAAIVKMGYLGFHYYPLLDDYIQYGYYPFANNPFSNIYLRIGLYSVRPLAGFGDIYVWGRFWGAMGIVLFIMTLLHAFSAYLFLLTSQKAECPVGMTFAVFYLLCPINFEGSYWISASSRIIVGLFLVSLSVFFLVHGKNFLFFLFQFVAMFLYEQVALVGFALSALIILQKKMVRSLWLVLLNIFILALYYKIFSTMGRYSYRIALQFFNFKAINDIGACWSAVSLYTKGFVRGLGMNILYFIPIVIVSVLIGSVEKAEKLRPKMLLGGIILFIVPYMPFLLLSTNNASFRTATIPLLGVALIADTLFNGLKRGKRAVACILSFVFMVICVSELADYRENYYSDRKIAAYVADKLDKNRTNAVIGAKEAYIESNADFAEHIKSVTYADWAITGCVREYLGDFTIPLIQINPKNSDNINLISLYDF